MLCRRCMYVYVVSSLAGCAQYLTLYVRAGRTSSIMLPLTLCSGVLRHMEAAVSTAGVE